MALNIIYGRSKAGKTEFCIKNMAAKKNSIMLVPEQFSFTAEGRFSALSGIHGMGEGEVLSFKRLAHRLLKNTGGFAKRRIDAVGKIMLVYKILVSLGSSLLFFKGREADGDTALEIAHLMSELKRYSISAKMLSEAAESMPSPLREKLCDLSLILSRYISLTDEKYIDTDDELSSLAGFLDSFEGFADTEFFIDQFSSFTHAETVCIEHLIKNAKNVTLTLCMNPSDSDNPAFTPPSKTAAHFKSFAIREKITVNETTLSRADAFKSRALSHLEKNFFAYPADKYTENTDDIILFEGHSPYNEVHFAAREILKLCRDRGYKMRDIAVAGRDLSAYENYISAIFPTYGITYFMDENISILAHPITSFLLSAIKIAINGFDYETVFSYAKSGFLRIPAKNIDILENYVLAAGIKPSAWQIEDKWNYKTSIYSDTNDLTDEEALNMETADKTRRLIAAPLTQLGKMLRERKSEKGKCEALYAFMNDIKLERRVLAMSLLFEKKGELSMAAEYRRVLDGIYSAITSMVYAIGDENISMKNFLSVLSGGLGQMKSGIIPTMADGVSVGTIGRIRGYNPRALFILGVNDALFPAPPTEGGLLTDADRQALLKSGIETAPPAEGKVLEEEHLIYTSLSLPTERLYLSYRTSEGGASQQPSSIITRMRDIFTETSLKSDLFLSEDDIITAPGVTFNNLLGALRGITDAGELPPAYREAYTWFFKNPDFKKKLETAENTLKYKNTAKALSGGTAKKLWGNSITTSVSRLESFAACPFSYFVKYTLGAAPRKILSFAAVDTGNFLHNFIDEFSKRLSLNGETWRTLTGDYVDSEIAEILPAMLGRVNSFAAGSEKYRHLFLRLTNIARRCVLLIAEHIKRGKFEPMGYELSFAENGDIKPLTVTLPTGFKITLTGRIDRADALFEDDKTYIRIIDYKSGNKTFALSEVFTGLNLQLAVYMAAFCESDKFKAPAKAAAMLYFKLDDPVVNAAPDEDTAIIENEKFKDQKMRGLVLSDNDMIEKMDSMLGAQETFLPVTLKKDGEFDARSSIASAKQFEALLKHTKKTVRELTKSLVEGNTSIAPCKIGSADPCQYCDFKSVCCFDVSLGSAHRRPFIPTSKDEIWQQMMGGDE